MLTHSWRDSEIQQMPQDGGIGKYSIPKGYVNATQMAKANKKLLADYIRLKSTTEYLQALSHDMGIPISSLLIEISGRANSQGTWIHPEIAIDLAGVGICRVPHLGQQNLNESNAHKPSRASTRARTTKSISPIP
ncbi:MAG: KilA-N domain-containing protein [Nostoc sp. EfeVER01]|uniref:KilA-N domain-containing protein n=1 Tax=Nostoc sp. EfeVER01 TaxID=3075406 RepID=UPI002AD27485|nr:KilA-N domain-containing protein [Nostoc sp. EfeVER01]MDZ7946266.1 KilA-N domain-containing protein [Nostoc sp. EfeVER01]